MYIYIYIHDISISIHKKSRSFHPNPQKMTTGFPRWILGMTRRQHTTQEPKVFEWPTVRSSASDKMIFRKKKTMVYGRYIMIYHCIS